MSGEAYGHLASKYYKIVYASGIRVSVAIPPDWDYEKNGDYVGQYFEDENKRFQNKLDALKSQLDEYFSNLANDSASPIIPFNSTLDAFDETRIEDVSWGQANTIGYHIEPQNIARIELLLSCNESIGEERLNEIKSFVGELFRD